jgi:hypothetical protein
MERAVVDEKLGRGPYAGPRRAIDLLAIDGRPIGDEEPAKNWAATH